MDGSHSKNGRFRLGAACAIFFGGMLLLGGRLADLRGRRLMFMGGLVLFTAASAFNGAAWNDTALVVGRAVQGLGAALLVPAALSLLVTTFPEGRERTLPLGVWSAATAVGGSFGCCSVGSSPSITNHTGVATAIPSPLGAG